MRKLQIQSLEELESIFREKTVDMTTNIRDSIQEAVNNRKKTALLFEIEVDGMDTSFEVSITTKEWMTALENCLKHYEEWGMSDEAIDTWQLIQKVK
jgi:hypothetical protein